MPGGAPRLRCGRDRGASCGRLAGTVVGAGLAITFVITRILHPTCYLADLDKLRSVVFLVGLGCIVALFVAAARAS